MTDTSKKLFEGAGVIVRMPGSAAASGTAIVVETEYAEQVSDLLLALKDIFTDEIDYFNKYEFYGRLAEAANNKVDRDGDVDAISRAIIAEACAIADEIGRHLYFAYGSNMDFGQMSHRCPKSLFVGTAFLDDHDFALDSAGVATVVEAPGKRVYGAIWLIAASDEQSLDGCEGVGFGCYRKAVLTVTEEAGGTVPALLYISNRGVHDAVTYRTGYMDNIIVNAKRLGFSDDYISHLESM